MKKKLSTQTSKEEGNRSLLSKPPRRTYNIITDDTVSTLNCKATISNRRPRIFTITGQSFFRTQWLSKRVQEDFNRDPAMPTLPTRPNERHATFNSSLVIRFVYRGCAKGGFKELFDFGMPSTGTCMASLTCLPYVASRRRLIGCPQKAVSASLRTIRKSECRDRNTR